MRSAAAIWFRISASSGEISSAGPAASFAQQLRRDEVDEALSPSGLLHDQQAASPVDDVANRVFLAFAEGGVGAA